MSKAINATSIYTVSTISYLKNAIIALESSKKYNSFDNYFIFIIDLKETSLNSVNKYFKAKYPWIQIFSSFNLDNFYKELLFQSFSFYSALEACCLCKFIGLKYLSNLNTNSTNFVYIDTDLFFFSDIENCIQKIKKQSFIVTPHINTLSNPFEEREFLKSGWLNAGFFVGNINGINFHKILDYLIERIFSLGYDAPELGLYCDQSWLNFIYQTFPDDFIAIRNDGFNVAYWNIMNRNIRKNNSQYLVNNTKLVFFHFSGFSINLNDKLSIHSHFSLIKNQEIKEIFKIYKSQFYKFDINIDKISVHSFNKGNLKSRINLRKKVLGTDFLGSEYQTGFFSKLGNRIDKIFTYLSKKLVFFQFLKN